MNERSPGGLDVARAFWIAVGLTLFLHLAGRVVPPVAWVDRPLDWFATLMHELGHGVVALLVGGEFRELILRADGSGTAMCSKPAGLASAAVSAGGLTGPSIAAVLGFVLARRASWSRAGLGVFALVLAGLLVTRIRTPFGVAFVAALILLFAAVALRGSPRTRQLTVMFLAVQLATSLWSDLGYMFSRVAEMADGPQPSDSANVASALGGPYWLWGALCAALSIAALALGGWLVLAGRPRRVAPTH